MSVLPPSSKNDNLVVEDNYNCLIYKVVNDLCNEWFIIMNWKVFF